MNPDDILSLLEELGSRLEPPARQAFEYAVRWQVANSLIAVLANIVAIILLTVTYIYILKKIPSANSRQEDILGYKVVTTGMYLLLLGGIFILLCQCVPNLISPEWAVLQQILPIN